MSGRIPFRRQLYILIHARQDVPTVRAIARATGISEYTLNSLLSGRSASPLLDTARRLCDYFGVSINYFGMTTEEACWRFLADAHAEHSDVLRDIRTASDALSPRSRAHLLPLVERMRRSVKASKKV